MGLDKPQEEPPVKRGRGRPKGSKNKHNITVIDPKTGVAITKPNGMMIMGKMGDERVTAFVQYHIDMMKMRQGCDKTNVPELYQRFYNYLAYCAEHGIIPNNMNAYYAIGVFRQEISDWYRGTRGTPQHKEFADDIMSFFASIHEQGGAENIVNPILSIYWSKAHDGMVEAKVTVASGEKTFAKISLICKTA